MKQIFILLFSLLLFIGCISNTVTPPTLNVTWYIPVRYMDTLDELPWKLLDAIDASKIKTYDSTWRELSRAEVESKITLDMRDVFFTKEECDIMIANGDFSFGEYLEPKRSAKQIEALYKRGRNIDSLFVIMYRPTFESKVFQLELVEKVKLDTTVRRQMGNMQAIRLIIPKEYTKSGANEILCQMKYDDFKSLALPEQKIIDNHTFIIYADYSDLIVDDGEKIQRLSSLKDRKEEYIPHDKIWNSVFRYFGKNIRVLEVFDETSKDGVLIKEIDY